MRNCIMCAALEFDRVAFVSRCDLDATRVLQTLMNTGYGDKFNYTAQAAEAISQLKLDMIRGQGGRG